MEYSIRKLGEELDAELKKGFDVARIANWAHSLFFYSRNNSPPEVADVLGYIYRS
jgi:hypothetical protein